MRRDWRMLVEAALIVPTIRVALWLLPFRTLLGIVERRPHAGAEDASIDRVLRAVHAIARRVPHASCLTRSLAAMVMLARHGHASTLRLGVAKDEGHVTAHAWLECDGRTILGDGEFVALLPVTRQSRVAAAPPL
jgi:hypothetical protein